MISTVDENFIRERITELRLQKNVSEHRMSLDLGHARSYVHGIVCGRTLPSMKEFLSICEYFEISPELFFSVNRSNGVQLTMLMHYAQQLPARELALVAELTRSLAGGQLD